MKSLAYFALPGIPLVEPGDDLADLIAAALSREDITLVDGDILVVAQKIVSKAEGRYVRLADVEPTPEATALAEATGKDPRHVQTVLSESSETVRHRKGVLIVAHRSGFVMANAGIDESNIAHPEGEERVLLLPADSDASAAALKARLDDHFGVAMGVIVNDSFGRPWRKGVVGVALGAAGVPSLVDMVGTPDLFGRPLRITEIAVADEIAAGASLLMGQAGEGLPVVLVRGYASAGPARPAAVLKRSREEDMFR